MLAGPVPADAVPAHAVVAGTMVRANAIRATDGVLVPAEASSQLVAAMTPKPGTARAVTQVRARRRPRRAAAF